MAQILNPGRRNDEGGLGTLARALQIYGTVQDIRHKSNASDALEEQKNDAAKGVLNRNQQIELAGKGFSASAEPTEGALEAIDKDTGNKLYFTPPKSKAELRTPATKEYRDSTGKNRIGTIDPTTGQVVMGQNDPLAASQPKDDKPPVDKTPGMADDLRNYRDKHEVTKTTNQLYSSYEKIKNAASNPSPAADMKLIYNFMKMQDPGSTVREGEYASAQNAGAVSDKVVNIYNKVLNGESLTPEQRADFLGQAGADWDAQRQRQQAFDKKVLQLAGKRNLSADDVIFNVYDLDTPAGQNTNLSSGGNNSVSREAALAEIQRRVGVLKQQNPGFDVDMKSPEALAAALREMNKRGSQVGSK